MTRQRPITVIGKVVAPLANDVFLVELGDGRQLRAHLSGAVRMKVVRILPGDQVEVEVASLDMTRGRIVDRLARQGPG